MKRPFDWGGLAVVVLAVGVIAAIIYGEVSAANNPGRVVSIEEVATVATVLGAAVGAIAGYVGARRLNGRYPPPSLPERADGEEAGTTTPPEDPGP